MKKTIFLSLSLYAGCSYYFLLNPHHLHLRQDRLALPPLRPGHRYSIAHRGGSVEAPENTLQGFQNSVNILWGINYIRLTE